MGRQFELKGCLWFIFACLFMGISLLLDAPWGRAYYYYNPVSEMLGSFYFSSISDSTGIPGISVSPFEMFSLALSAVGLYKLFSAKFNIKSDRQRDKNLINHSKHLFFALLTSLSIIFISGMVSGFQHGNDFALMLTQVRSLVMLPVWLIIGMAFITSSRQAWVFLAVIAVATFLKSLQGLWSYVYLLGGHKGMQEYIVEHITSSFIITAGLVINGLLWLSSTWRIWKVLVFLGTNGLLGFIFLANDRRAALIGFVLGIGIVALATPHKFYRRYIVGIATLGLTLVFFLGLTWNSSGVLGFPARTIKSLLDPSESSAGYREVENANLLLAIANEPLTGLGFGKRFPVVFPLPDISAIYSEYDLIPHNTLLFVWAFAGPLGMAGLGAFFALGLGLSLRIFRDSHSSSWRILGMIGAFVLAKALAYIYADIGLREVRLLAEVGAFTGFLTTWNQHLVKEGEV